MKRGVKLAWGECNPSVRNIEVKSAASKRLLREERNREPSLVSKGEGHGRGEALGEAAPKNPAA